MASKAISSVGRRQIGGLRSKASPSILANLEARYPHALAAVSSAQPNPSSSDSTSPPPASALSRSPFEPFRSEQTGRWRPAYYSMRRQAELSRAALAEGRLSALAEGPKRSKLLSRIASSQRASSFAAEVQPESTPYPLSAAFFEKHRRHPSAFDEQTIRSQQRRIISHLVQEKGPYMGRAKRQQMRDRAVPGSIKLKSIFKGTRGEREKPSRQRDILENMQAMKQRVDNWREEKAQARSKKRPSQPF